MGELQTRLIIVARVLCVASDSDGGHSEFSLGKDNRAVTGEYAAVGAETKVAICLFALLSPDSSLWIRGQGGSSTRLGCGMTHTQAALSTEMSQAPRQHLGLRWVTVF